MITPHKMIGLPETGGEGRGQRNETLLGPARYEM